MGDEVAAPSPTVRTFGSRPDLSPSVVTVATPGRGTQPGFVFAAPFKGPWPVRPCSSSTTPGEPVWCKPIEHPTAMDFRVQRYRGQDVLTWWQGKVEGGYGGGTGLIFDRKDQRVARVKGSSRVAPRSSRSTNSVEADLSGVGGPGRR